MANQAFVAWVELKLPEFAGAALTQAAATGSAGELAPSGVPDARAYVAWVALELPEALAVTLELSQAAAEGLAGVLVPSSVPVGALPVGDQPWWLAHGGVRVREPEDEDEEERPPVPQERPQPPSVPPPVPQAAGLLADPPLPRKRYAPLRPVKSRQREQSSLSTDEDDEEVLLLLV